MDDLVPLERLDYSHKLKPACDLGQPCELAHLPLDQLFIDRRYQRDILREGKGNVRSIVEHFSWKKFGVIVVGRRGPRRFAIIDGQHRAVAAFMHGAIRQVPCLVIEGGLELEAAIFSAINGKITRISPLQSFHADVVAGNPQAVALKAACDAARVTISRRPKIDLKPGETMTLRLLKATFDKNPALLAAALKLLRALDPKAGIPADPLRGTIQALAKLDVLPEDPAALGARIAAGGGTTGKMMDAAWQRKQTRGGPTFLNFRDVLLDRIRAAQRATPENLKRMMAGR